MYQIPNHPNWLLCNYGSLLFWPPKRASSLVFNMRAYYGYRFGSSDLQVTTWYSKASAGHPQARTFCVITNAQNIPPHHGQGGMVFTYYHGNPPSNDQLPLPMQPAQKHVAGQWAQPELGAFTNYPPSLPFIWQGIATHHNPEPQEWSSLSGQMWHRAGRGPGVGLLPHSSYDQETKQYQTSGLFLAICPHGICFGENDHALHLLFTHTGRV